MAQVTIDFEVRSNVSVKDVGAHKYAEHDSTKPFCLAVKVGNEPCRLWLSDIFTEMGVTKIEGTELLSREEVFSLLDKADTIVAHNIGFEAAIWPKFCWPFVYVLPVASKGRCTAAEAAYHALPRSLDQVLMVLGLPQQKDKFGAQAMRRTCIGKGGVGKPHSNVPSDLVATARYCIQDAEAEAALASFLRPLPPKERLIWLLDMAINNRGVAIDVETCAKIQERLEVEVFNPGSTELWRLTEGLVKTPKQVAALNKWLDQQGVKLSDLSEESIDKALSDSRIQGPVRKVLEIRQELAASAPAKYASMQIWACQDGRARGLLLYHGASTGRWTGRGVQPQNFPRGDIPSQAVPSAIGSLLEAPMDEVRLMWGRPMTVAGSCLRAMLRAQAGSRLLCSDFSEIEARGLAWLAGAKGTLKAFEEGRSSYVYTASRIYGVEEKAVTKDQRQIGKTAVLACGYQGAVGAFQKMAKNYGIDIPDDKALAIVKAWRAANEEIVSLWYAAEKAAINAVKEGKAQQCGKVFYGVRDNWLLCRLPSGRMLHYYRPKIEEEEFRGKIVCRLSVEGTNSYTHQWERNTVYGGLLVENIVQGMCRDIMAEGMLRLEAKGYKIVLSVHDEIVAEMRYGEGTLTEFERVMAENPPWALGLPIKAHGWEGTYYRKD